MPVISKIRLTNVLYEEGSKRYNDEMFMFDGHNGAILLENGGGKTVLIQTALQAIHPHTDLAGRKIKSTLQLENSPAHIAIEWIINEQPRRYLVTAVTLFVAKNALESLRYVYEYEANDPNGITGIPYVRDGGDGKRAADRGEMVDYYAGMRERSIFAKTFSTIKEYRAFIETQYHIIADEWDSIVKINSNEGGVEAFFDECKYTNQLFDRLLIPIVEDSIAGHERKLFADMFEKQHSSFRQYKKLKETIEENKRIQNQLEGYVHTFEQLHRSLQAYQYSKQRAKGTWNYIHEEKRNASKLQEEIQGKLQLWKQAETAHHVITASYDIAEEHIRFQQLAKDYDNKLSQSEQKKEQLAEYERNYYSLRLADFKRDRNELEQKLQYYQSQLDALNETQSFQEIHEQLEQTKAALLGCFMEQMEQIDNEARDITYERNPILQLLERDQQELEQVRQRQTEQQKIASEMEGQINTRTEDMRQIENRLLGNPEQERVEEEFPRWNTRIQFLDEEAIRLRQEGNQIEIERQNADCRVRDFQQQKQEKEQQRIRLADHLQHIEKQQKLLIDKLAKVRAQWANLDNIYEHESTIVGRLTDTIDQLAKEKEQLLHQERLAFRFVDDHGNQDHFFGDAYIATQFKAWKQQFDYVRTGVEYVQSMEETVADYEQIQRYPLWGLTLITTSKALPYLQERLLKVADRLQYPIQIISTEQTTEIYKVDSALTWTAPSHWKQGIEGDAFARWKETVVESARKHRQRRENKEREIKVWESAFSGFLQYLEQHPYEYVQQQKLDQSELINSVEQLTRTIHKEQQQIDQLVSRKNQLKDTIEKFEKEKQGLEWKAEKGAEYLRYKKEVVENQQVLRGKKEQLVLLNREMKSKEKKIEQSGQLINELDARIKALEYQLKTIKDNKNYQAVKDMTPQFSGESQDTIEERIKDRELQVLKISTSYNEWKTKYDHVKKDIDKNSLDIENLRREHKQLDETRQFPTDGKLLMDDIWSKIGIAKDLVQKLEIALKEALSAKDKQEGKWQNLKDTFADRFLDHTIVHFADPLEEVNKLLQQEYTKLQEQRRFLEQEQQRNKHEIGEIEKAERSLFGLLEAHHFNAPDVEAIAMSSDEVRDFAYDHKRFVDQIIHNLKETQSNVQNEQHNVESSKQSFHRFCQSISDVKMKKMAIDGVEYKNTYEDLLHFKRNMMVTVERATNYANEHIRQKDVELQAFINQIHAHLQTIVEELRQIPKKTKVKIEDDWKTIYHFNIPEWPEQDGQHRIRNYIEWILQQLETDRYLSQAELDHEKVRKDIETWLQTKQLLQVVMNNEGMRVSCRKVTNDNKVSKKVFSWEQSNIWSGGEKWSKNMTLFLGLLNYVAEKKQHIQPNLRRHRAVILDNPFGKASSEHVLNPVFFVAEQLGFQIIALTAHTEGKFLQDHFPVLYSCRLREAADPTKQIMTKEKWLHYAYFQDHEPKSLDRLGETEQIDMFTI